MRTKERSGEERGSKGLEPFILSTSCEIPPRSSPDVVKWLMEAAREYGRYERILR